MAMNSTFTSLTRVWIVTIEPGCVESIPGEDTERPGLEATNAVWAGAGSAAVTTVIARQKIGAVYFIPKPSNICTNSSA